jgi:hypothetical protein
VLGLRKRKSAPAAATRTSTELLCSALASGAAARGSPIEPSALAARLASSGELSSS